MSRDSLWARAKGRARNTMAHVLERRMVSIAPAQPIVSFTFDDFPRSALHVGGTILRQYGAWGTYYASLGLMGGTAPTGEIFTRDDLEQLLVDGHELGSHTFDHCDPWTTAPRAFEASIESNRVALLALYPGLEMRSFSYPYSVPSPRNKRRAGKHFAGCRDHGQKNNAGRVDLNLLDSHFLEMKLGGPEAALQAIEENRQACGWLIFSTHDLCEQPTTWGWRPDYFEQVVCCAAESGARLLTVAQALDALQSEANETIV